MNKKDIILYASIAAGGYLAYWYVTNYGPLGAVSAGAVSYWDTWFGSQSAAIAPPATTGLPASQITQQQPGLPPATTVNGTPVQTSQPLAGIALVKSKIQDASRNNNYLVNGQMNADMWYWYYQQFAPQLADFNSIFVAHGEDRNNMPVMTLDQFLSAIQSAGVSITPNAGLSGVGAIVQTGNVQSLPVSQPPPVSAFGRNGPPAKRGYLQ